MGSKSKQPAARLGDIASNHGPWPPTPIIAGAGSVTINGIPAARKGDAVLLHAIPNNPPHARSIAEGAGSVIIEGKPAARVSDAISCGGKVATGSGDVSIGDSPSLLKAAAVNIPDLNIPDIVFAKQTGSIAKSKSVTPTQTTALQADDAVIYTPPPAAPAEIPEAADTLSANKQSAVDYWSQQKDSADNFPEYLAAHLMGLNAETGYSIAEGLKATYEIVTDKDKFLTTMDAVKDSFVDTVTDPIGTYNSIKQAAVEFSQLPLSEQGEAAYKGMMGLLAGGGTGKAVGALGKAARGGKADSPNMRTIISPEVEAKILYGQRAVNNQGNATNRLIGAHSGNISNANPNFAVETISVNADATRNVKLITQFPDGNISRIKNSTLFPESWSDTEVMSAVTQTGNGAPLAIRVADGASLHQSTINGVKVEVIKVEGNVTAGYPCGRGCTDPSTFGGN